ncbi:hypothetical protein QCA50_002170 [Cerrena zonata]|uniref:Uncharacterized protein n=1 Tax=Cerrena zonata TaxID=2478898 RepID=A0AAW0GSQ7_9APHY
MIQTTHPEATHPSTTALRASHPLSATRRDSSRTFVPTVRRSTRHSPVVVRPERFTFCEDDLVDVNPLDISGLPDWQTQFARSSSTSTPTGLRSFLSRSKSSLTGLKDSSRVQNSNVNVPSLRPKFKLGSGKSRVKKSTKGLSGSVVLALPQSLPSVHEASSDEEGSVHAVFTDDSSSSHYIKSSGLSVVTSENDIQPSSTQAHSSSEQPNLIRSSPSHVSLSTPTSGSSILSHSSSTLTSVRKSLKRFTSRTKGNIFTSTNPSSDVHQTLQTPSTSNEARASSDAPHILPELSFDASPLPIFIHEEQDIKDSPSEDLGSEIELTEPTQVPGPVPDIPLIRYEFVDPQDLTASPAVTLGTSYSLSGASFQSPSPSWLSRNVGTFELSVKPERPLLRIHPPSPDPLPILPRGYLEAPEAPRQPNNSERLSLPGTPHSTGSSVTLYSHSQRISYLSAQSTGSRPPSINRSSIVSFRHSFIDKRGSVSSFVTCASITLQHDEEEVDLPDPEENNPAKPRFFLLLHPPSPEPASLKVPSQGSRTSLSPLDIFGISTS